MTLLEAFTTHLKGIQVQICTSDGKWHSILPYDPWFTNGYWVKAEFRIAPSALLSVEGEQD